MYAPSTAKKKVYRTELRYRDKEQKNAFEKISKKHNRSVNAEHIVAIDYYMAAQNIKDESTHSPII